MTLHQVVGPATAQALLLARYQALRRIGQDVAEVDESDVISQKPTREEVRIMTFNASVVSALEDIFSWMHKDRSNKTSQLSFVESWRFHRAVYRVWTMSTLYGYESAPHGRLPEATSIETQAAFLSKYTSQELVQINKVCCFLRTLAGWVILAERRLIGSLDFHDFDSLYLFAGPYIILRCFEEESSSPLPLCYSDEVYEDFLFIPLDAILSQREVTIPLAFVGSILDDVHGAHNACRECGCNDWFGLSGTQSTANLFNENNWTLLKGFLGTPSEIFLKLSSNRAEKPLFNLLHEAKYDALIDELFSHKGEPYQDWSRNDWVCMNCFRGFFVQTVFRWWRALRVQAGERVPQDCRHGYYCRDQCFDQGLDHARRFNHACVPLDEVASLAHFHGH